MMLFPQLGGHVYFYYFIVEILEDAEVIGVDKKGYKTKTIYDKIREASINLLHAL